MISGYCSREQWFYFCQFDNGTAAVFTKIEKKDRYTYLMPFGSVYLSVSNGECYDTWAEKYIKQHSILSYLPASLMYSAFKPAGEIIALTEEQKHVVNQYFNVPPEYRNIGTCCTSSPNNNLIIVLVESLESWPISDIGGINYMPYLSSLVQDEHTLYSNKMKPQIRYGNSADGQMLCVTGLLPIHDGATCILYGTNNFPSIAECYPHSAIINPARGEWGQQEVTYAYHFKELIEPTSNNKWHDDAESTTQLHNYLDTVSEPFCVMLITATSHVPFAYGAQKPLLKDDMPLTISAYLRCMNYADSCMGTIIHRLETTHLSKTTTLVITGDHTIFRAKEQEFDDYATKYHINFRTKENSIPFIVYSPLIDHNIMLNDTCYQMDIFPTLTDVLGLSDYYWKGFGTTLRDTTLLKYRILNLETVDKVSNLLIQSNYFSGDKKLNND